MLSDSRFAQIIYNLRVADAYYYAEARCRRAAHCPTYHAKRRALRIDLRVDTDTAARMSSIEAYAMRYPEIIQTYSPVIQSNTYVPTTAWVAGPTANDLLRMNVTLAEYLAVQPVLDRTCNRRMHPSSTRDVPCVYRSLPVDHSALSSSGVLPSDSSASPSSVTTPVRRCP
jgi:hypothetical protein